MAGSNITLHRHPNPKSFAIAIADRLAEQLTVGLKRRQAGSIAVPGGTTPGPIFDELAKRPIDWPHINITLTDERWVSANDPDSNEKLVRSRLLQGEAAQSHFVGLHKELHVPSTAVPAVTKSLEILPLPFDVVLLGMGDDGHFASLFPGMSTLLEGLSSDNPDPCIPSDQPINGHPRMSLTLRMLLHTRVILLAIRGAKKLQVIEQAKSARPEDMPIAAILTQTHVPVEIHYTE